MRGKELWGVILVCFGAPLWLWAWAPYGTGGYAEGPQGQELVFYRWGFTEYSLQGAIGLLGGLAGSTGFILLATSLIGRIHAAWLRYSAGFLVVLATMVPAAVVALNTVGYFVAVASMPETFREVAPDGQAVVVRSGGFDPNAIGIFTEYDRYRYQYQQTAHFERPQHVHAEGCHLDAATGRLVLTCGRQTVDIDPAPTAETN